MFSRILSFRKKNNIFIHSLFRTGSTYLWSTLKKNKNIICFYEPLNEQLLTTHIINDISLIKKNNHHGLTKNYFNEYSNTNKRIKYLTKSIIVDEFCEISSRKQLYNYIRCLNRNNQKISNIFQFNRTSLRSKWFKEIFPESNNIYIYRNHIDQWYSIINQYRKKNLYFLTMNILWLSKNKNHKYFQPIVPLIQLPDIPPQAGENQLDYFAHDYNYAYSYTYYLTINEHYLIHYYLWKLSLKYNKKYCDFCIDMSRLNDDLNYRKLVSAYFLKQTGFEPCFDNILLPKYTEIATNMNTMKDIELTVNNLLKQILL